MKVRENPSRRGAWRRSPQAWLLYATSMWHSTYIVQDKETALKETEADLRSFKYYLELNILHWCTLGERPTEATAGPIIVITIISFNCTNRQERDFCLRQTFVLYFVSRHLLLEEKLWIVKLIRRFPYGIFAINANTDDGGRSSF